MKVLKYKCFFIILFVAVIFNINYVKAEGNNEINYVKAEENNEFKEFFLDGERGYPFKAKKEEDAFKDAQKELLEYVQYRFFSNSPEGDKPSEIKTEMIIPARIFVNMDTRHDGNKYNVQVQTQTIDMLGENIYEEKDLTATQIQKKFLGDKDQIGTEIINDNYEDKTSAKKWDVYLKVEVSTEQQGDEIYFKFLAKDIALNKDELSINPQDLPEPEKTKDPSNDVKEGVEKTQEKTEEFGKDSLRNKF